MTSVTDLSEIEDIYVPHTETHAHEGESDKEDSRSWHADSFHPHAIALTPVFRTLFGREKKDVVGVLLSVIPFDKYLNNLLPKGAGVMEVVLWNTCGQSYTYHVHGQEVSS